METKVEREYHPNGELRSEHTYVDGKRHGMVKYWFHSGELSYEYPYVDGKRHGMMKSWRHRDGDIVEFCLYNQGELVATFYPQNKAQRWKLK
jgi:antitoxin component YwqK of YwqJK toxin-antitoxin module